MNNKRQKKVVITGRKTDDTVIVKRKVIDPRRRIEEAPLPINDEEWDKFFNDHQYGFGADLKARHGIDLMIEDRPLGPWFERYP